MGNSNWGLCNKLEGWIGERDGKGGSGEREMAVPMADSCGCLTENHKIL